MGRYGGGSSSSSSSSSSSRAEPLLFLPALNKVVLVGVEGYSPEGAAFLRERLRERGRDISVR